MILKKSEIKHILVINLESISEVILSTPVMRALKENYTDASVTMLTVPFTAATAEMNPFVDEVITYDKRGEHRGISGVFEMVTSIRGRKFDLCLCLNHSPRGALVAWAAGIKYRAGYDAAFAKFFLTHAADSGQARVQHQTINHLRVLKPLGIATQDTSIALAVDENVEKIMKTTLEIADDRPIVAFCPMNAEHPKRNLSKEKCLEIIEKLEETAHVYLIGGAAEKPYLRALAEAARIDQTRVFAGKLNLKEAAVFLKHAAVLLSVDAGAIHVAQALETPVVAIFGPTDPLVYGPCGNRDVALTHRAPCMPCAAKRICTRNQCIEEIPVEEIVAKVLERV